MKFKLLIYILFNFLLLISTQATQAQEGKRYLDEGIQKAYEGNYKKAMRLFNKAIRKSPDYALAYYNRGHIKYELKDYYGSIADCSRAIELDKTLTDAYFNLAISKFHLDKFREAIRDFDRAIELNPEDDESFCWRGISQHKLGKIDAACKDWKKAKSLGNSYVNDYLNKYCGEENSVETGEGGD